MDSDSAWTHVLASATSAALATAVVLLCRVRGASRPPPPSIGAAAVRIRPLRAADEQPWRQLWAAYHKFYKASVPDAVYRSTFARLTGEGEGGGGRAHTFEVRGLVAEEEDGCGGRLLGLAHHMEQRHCWTVENIVYLQDLFVLPEARGRGVGRQLIEAVYAAADAAGTPAVYWNTHHTNHAARKLYDRIGGNSGYIKYKRPATQKQQVSK